MRQLRFSKAPGAAAKGMARVLGVAALVVCVDPAAAQNAARGKQLYESRFNPNFLTCSDAACHGVNPLANMNRIRNGTSGQAILTAVGAVPLMSPLRNLVSQGDAADIAAYIANPAAATPTGGLAASSPSLAFGATAVGATNANSNPAVSTVTNTSTAAVTISGIAKSGTNAGEFTATGSCVSASSVQLAPGASCTLGATFAPTAAGTRSATLTVQSNASTNPAIALSGTATVVAAATLAVSRSSVAFPTQTISTTSTAQDVAVRNTGTASLTITEVTAAPMPEFSTSSTCTGILVPGGGCSVVVVFTPSAAGLRTGSVTITTSSGATTIAVTGNSVLTPTPIVTTGEGGLTLGSIDVGSAPPTKSISIGNTGNAPLEIAAVELRGADARDFAFTSANTCKAGALAPQQECRLEVEFKPQGAGAKTASVALAHNASGGATTIAVSGTATVAPAPAPTSSANPPAQGGGGSFGLVALAVMAAVALVRGRRRLPGRAAGCAAASEPSRSHAAVLR